MEAITNGAGAEAAAEVQVEMIRHHHTITNRLADRNHRQQGLLQASKVIGLDSGRVRWAVLPPVILRATEVETSKHETRAGAISKAEEYLEEQIRVEVSSGMMQEKGVRCGADGVDLGLRGPSRLRGTKALGLDPPVADEYLCYGECRR